MNKLAICGDSFNAVSKILPDTHYSELLSKRLGWQLLNFARRGCSNGGIRLQIQEAINQQANFVIIVPTGWDRMEVPVRDNFYQHPDGPTKTFGKLLQEFLLDRKSSCFDVTKGISNINYDASEENQMIFETIFSLAENYDHEYRKDKLSNEKVTAIKHFINHIYDSAWKHQTDKWVISSGVSKLYENSIPFSIERGMLWEDRKDILKDVPTFIPSHYIRQDNELIGTGTDLYPLKDEDEDPGYHSQPAGQEWIANLYEQLMKNIYKLC